MSKIRTVEISFPVPVELPDGWDRVLSDLVDMVCKQYERENPTQVMWPAGIGSKPTFSKADAAFLGKPAIEGAPDAGEPTFDDDCFYIEVSEREDYHGRNPLNPDGERLRAARASARQATKART